MRVLVVDDEPVVLAVAVEALTDAGFEAFPADNAVSALDCLSESEPPVDVLLTDVRMPRGSGLDLARIAQRLWPRMRVVVTSGHVDPDHSIPGENVLRKPWSRSELVARITQAVA